MSKDSTSHPNVFVSKALDEKARTDPAYARFLEDIRKCRELFGVEPEMNDFQSGGLRFNVFSDLC